MNLVIDMGNTSCKMALFLDGEMIKYRTCRIPDKTHIEKFCAGHDITAGIWSSVAKVPLSLCRFLGEEMGFIRLDENTSLPLKNAYQTPATLGKDRLACAVAANAIFPGKNVLVIDAGTCIKYDFVTAKSVYLGGAISPGLRMRLKAMHTFTAKLPLIRFAAEGPLVGRNTRESMLSGALNGALAEIEGMISRYRKEYGSLNVILTGGDMPFFEKRLKSRIFAAPHLVMQGLNIILEYHAKKKRH